MNLPGPAIERILDFLDLKTLFILAALKRGLPLRSTIKTKMNAVLVNRLKKKLSSRSPKLFAKLEQVASQYADKKAIAIAGSTMVETIVGASWFDTDIDIYTAGGAANQIRNVLVQEGFVLVRSGMDDAL